MACRNTTTSYGSVTKLFHWIIATLIILMLIIGLVMSNLDKSPFRTWLYQLHKSIGLTILFLMVLRLLWRWVNPTPAHPSNMPKLESYAAHGLHYVLYIAIFIMASAGWTISTAGGHVTSFWWLINMSAPGIPKNHGLKEFAETVHLVLAWTITGLLIIHIAAAIKNHVKNKNDVLIKMMPSKK